MSKQRNIRKRRTIDIEDDDDLNQEQSQTLTAEEIKLLQKQRQKRTVSFYAHIDRWNVHHHAPCIVFTTPTPPISSIPTPLPSFLPFFLQGVDASALALGSKTDTHNHYLSLDATAAADADEDGGAGASLHHAFNREQQRSTTEADADTREKQYIEEQLANRLGKPMHANTSLSADHPHNQPQQNQTKRIKTVDEMAMEAAAPKQKDAYEDPGAAFVAGISEVPLSVAQRLKNIETTEAAKVVLLQLQQNPGQALHGGGGGGGGGGVGVGTNGRGTTATATTTTTAKVTDRGQFPVRFGKMSKEEQSAIDRAKRERAVAKMKALEKKKAKDRGGFKGFF